MTHKLSVRYVVVLASLALLGVGCGGVSFNGSALKQNTSSSTTTEATQVPACEINVPQLEINGTVDSFEFQGSGGITFGYNQNQQYGNVGGAASVQISTASLALSMEADNPLNGQRLTGTTVSSSQTSTNVNATIDFSQFSVSPNYFYSTPLSKVSSGALSKGVAALKSLYDSVGWTGNIIQIEPDGSTVLINAGAVNGLMVGDTFSVYNMNFLWADTAHPCAQGNTFFTKVPTTQTPIANVTLINVDPTTNVAVGTMLVTGSTPVLLGAEVHPNVLVGKNRYLKKNAVLGTIGAQSFTLPGGGTFDFGTAINGQLRNAVSSGGFVVQN